MEILEPTRPIVDRWAGWLAGSSLITPAYVCRSVPRTQQHFSFLIDHPASAQEQGQRQS